MHEYSLFRGGHFIDCDGHDAPAGLWGLGERVLMPVEPVVGRVGVELFEVLWSRVVFLGFYNNIYTYIIGIIFLTL